MDIELVTDPYACMMYIVSPLAVAGLDGHILAASRLQLVEFQLHVIVIEFCVIVIGLPFSITKINCVC